MNNYKLITEYDGTGFNGWQKQHSTQNTIQGKFEQILEKLCGHTVEIFASGRTDAGVHAKGQVFNFKTEKTLVPAEIADYCNRYLPQAVRVLSCEAVDERFHSRYLAVRKKYSYTIAYEKPSVFLRKYVYYAQGEKPDVSKIKQCAQCFLGTHDFLAFSSMKRSKKSTVRTIEKIEITNQGGLLRIEFTGDGFLYHMVRILAGTLWDAGMGKIDEKMIYNALESGVRQDAGTMLPPEGLVLEWVEYDK